MTRLAAIDPTPPRADSPLYSGVIATAYDANGPGDASRFTWPGGRNWSGANVTVWRNANIKYFETESEAVQCGGFSSYRCFGQGRPQLLREGRSLYPGCGRIETVRLLLVSNALETVATSWADPSWSILSLKQPEPWCPTWIQVNLCSFYAGVKLDKLGSELRNFGVLVPTSDTLKRLKIGNSRARIHRWNSFDISWSRSRIR